VKRRYKLLFGIYQGNFEIDGKQVQCTFNPGDEFETEVDLLTFNGRQGMTPKFGLVDSAVLDENTALRAKIAELQAELRQAREAQLQEV